MTARVRQMRASADALPEGVDPLSDLANAHRLARDQGADLRHVPELGWFAWNRSIWSRDEAGAYRCAMASAERLRLLAIECLRIARDKSEHDAADKLLTHARRSQQEPQIRRALELARRLPPIATSTDAFDREPMLFACANGTIDLRTGELHAPRREDLITRASPIAYDAGATCPAFAAFLARILPDDDLRTFVHRAIGYSLTGDTGEQVFFVAHGSGANGKSTLLETLRHVLGDHATHASTDTFMQSRQPRGVENDVARLQGARLVTAIESAQGHRLDEERIKRLTGGDTVTGCYKYREPFEFRPVCKLWLATNDLPRIDGGEGIWRRVRRILFGVTIPEGERDPDLLNKLRAEAPGILAWAVRGCRDWQSTGLGPPESVTDATEGWRQDEDPLRDWIADECREGVEHRASAKDLYASYTRFAAREHTEPISQTAFGRRLAQRGCEKIDKARPRAWRGLALRSPDQAEVFQ